MKRAYIIGCIIVGLSFLVGCGTTSNSRGNYSSQNQIAEVTLRKGKEVKRIELMSVNEDDAYDIIDQLADHDVTLNSKKYLCEGAKETEWRLMRLVELKSEIDLMIEAINRRQKPRLLKPAEKYVLSQVQACRPFLVSLKTIVSLLNGNDIDSIKYTKR